MNELFHAADYRRSAVVVQTFRSAGGYDTLTTVMTGVMLYDPLPSCLTD